MGQAAEALADTARLTADDPDSEEAQLLHAGALAALQRTDEAVAACRAALQANPFSTPAAMSLARLYLQDNRLSEALQTCDDWIETYPDCAEAYRMRAAVKMALHNSEGAADDMKRALTIRPEQQEEISGEFSNIENRVNERYRNMNPYQF